MVRIEKTNINEIVNYKMENKKYNYIVGSLIGLISRNNIEDTAKEIEEKTKDLKSIYDIERICKGILFPLVDETKESQAVRLSKEIAQHIIIFKNDKNN